MEVHLRLLRYFAAVADELSYTRAARRLHITQPALSKQIQQLEDQLRVRLLDRDSRGVRLTAAGRALHDRVPDLLAAWTATFAAVRDVELAESAVLRVGFTTATTSELVRVAAADFGRRHPGWRIAMAQMSWADPTAMLRSREVDLAFVRHPLPVDDAVRYLDVRTEPRVLALPVDHRLTGQDVVDFSEVLDETFVPLVAGPWRDYWLCLDQRGGRPVRLADPVAGPEEWAAAISAGRGIAVTSARAATYYARPGLAFRPLRGLSPSVVAIAWRRDDGRHAVEEFVRSCIGTATSGESPPPPPHTTVLPVDGHGPQPPQPRDVLRVAVSSESLRIQQQILHAHTHVRTANRPALRQVPTDSTRSRVDAVLDRTVDLAFVRLGDTPAPALRHLPLATAPMLLAVPTGHPLAAAARDQDGVLPLNRLDRQPLAFYHRDQNPWWYDDVLALLTDHGAHPHINYRGLWVYDVLPEVNARRALALVSVDSAADVALPNVAYVRLDPAPRVHLGLLWHTENTNPAVEDFIGLAATLTST